MTKNILLLVALFSISNFSAQDKFVGLSFGGVFGNTKLGNWDEYANYYNDYYEDQLASNLGRMNFASGFEIGFNYSIYNDGEFGLGLELMNERKFASTSADFKDASLGTRYIQAKYTNNILFWNFSYSFDQVATICGPYLGFGRTNFSAFKKYDDGTISYGHENGLNIVDEAQSFCFGLKLGIEYLLTENIHLYSNFVMGVNWDLISDTPLPTGAVVDFPLIYIVKQFTLNSGIRIGITK